MKRISIVLFAVSFAISCFLTSCSPTETTSISESSSSIPPTSDNSALLHEIAKLKMANYNLVLEQSSLNARIVNLEQNLEDATKGSPLENNYTTNELLERIFKENSKVDIFPGILQNIRMETIDEYVYFIFSIDKLEVNPTWDGPADSGEEGYYINSEEKYEEYKGGSNTIFGYQGYKTYEMKQEDILANYGNKFVYIFYMIGDEIVLVGPYPGP